MIKRILYILILSGSTLLQANADEGMWMLTDLKQQNAVAMMELGLEIPIDQVYNPNGISLKDALYTLAEDVPEKLYRLKALFSPTIIVVMELFSNRAAWSTIT